MLLSLPFVDEQDAGGGERHGDNVFRSEGFVKENAGGEGSRHGDEGIVDGNFADRIDEQQLIVEHK